MRKVAPGVWLKKLFTAHQMYCASLFPGAIRPALRLCMRALRARLGNVLNETNDLYIHNEKNEMPAKEAFRCFRGFCWVWGRAHFLARGARFLGAGASVWASAGAAAGAAASAAAAFLARVARFLGAAGSAGASAGASAAGASAAAGAGVSAFRVRQERRLGLASASGAGAAAFLRLF